MSFLTNELEGALVGAARGFLLRSLIIDLAIVKEKIILQGEFFNHLSGFEVLATIFHATFWQHWVIEKSKSIIQEGPIVELQIELERKNNDF